MPIPPRVVLIITTQFGWLLGMIEDGLAAMLAPAISLPSVVTTATETTPRLVSSSVLAEHSQFPLVVAIVLQISERVLVLVTVKLTVTSEFAGAVPANEGSLLMPTGLGVLLGGSVGDGLGYAEEDATTGVVVGLGEMVCVAVVGAGVAEAFGVGVAIFWLSILVMATGLGLGVGLTLGSALILGVATGLAPGVVCVVTMVVGSGLEVGVGVVRAVGLGVGLGVGVGCGLGVGITLP